MLNAKLHKRPLTPLPKPVAPVDPVSKEAKTLFVRLRKVPLRPMPQPLVDDRDFLVTPKTNHGEESRFDEARLMAKVKDAMHKIDQVSQVYDVVGRVNNALEKKSFESKAEEVEGIHKLLSKPFRKYNLMCQDMDYLRSVNGDFEEENKDLRKCCRDLIEEAKGDKEEIEDLRAKLQAYEKEKEAWKEEWQLANVEIEKVIGVTQVKCARMKTDFQDLEEAKRFADVEIEGQNSKILKLKSKVAKLQAKNKDLEDSLAASNLADEELRAKFDIFVKRLKEIVSCPISHQTMKDPVTTPLGVTYERKKIEQWIEAKGMDPFNPNAYLLRSCLQPNKALCQVRDLLDSL
jgi:hypothetical protein